MNTRHLLAARAFCAAASFLSACASSDPDLGKTAADPSVVGPVPSAGSGVLRPGFDPSSLGPPAATGGGHEHHHHHQQGAHEGPPLAPASASAPAPPSAMPPGHQHPPSPSVPK